MISYAQNFEDVMIARLFPCGHRGFYIDVGAADPVYLSVSKHFYDSGWCGVNIEPLPRFFERLTKARPRDINLRAVIGGVQSQRTFFEIAELPENSTSDQHVMSLLKGQGRTIRTHEVEALSLESICERYTVGRVIDFMKIDVEGGELEVLQSANWQRFRPILLVVEAVVVNGREETWMCWESVITKNGYQKVWFDGLNNFYLRSESLHLKKHFCLPPNVFDDITVARLEVATDEWIDLAEVVKRIDADRLAKQEIVDRLVPDLTAANADCHAKQAVVDRLVAELTVANADRQAKQAVVDRLVPDLTTANADRQAKQSVVDRLVVELAQANADRHDKQVLIEKQVARIAALEAAKSPN